MKKPIFKKWWFWVIVIVLAIGATASRGMKELDKAVDKISTNNTPSKDDKKKNEPKIFNVGDVVELKNFRIAVNKVYNVPGNNFAKPKDGNEFVAVDCTVENISDKEQTVSSALMFKVVDKDGRACEYSIMGLTAAKAGQMDGQVAAGRKLTGVYVVEVPKGTTGLELEFNSSLFTGGQVIVKLN